LFSYSIIRFFLEFLRDDPRGVFLLNIFSPSQFISIIILFILSIKILKFQN
jgi:prolipoprotein diacylglyceryltransferase